MMLCLHSKNGRRACQIMDKLGDFVKEYNNDLDYNLQASTAEKFYLNKLDLATQSKIKTSLMCRFLPTTILDMYVSEDKKTFLDIYKHDDIQNEYIIWNAGTREHLLSTLRNHIAPHLKQLGEFSCKDFDFIKVPGNLPLYTQKFSQMVQYEKLDKEIKIGKFYARMWVKNATSIQMTNNDLQEFYLKLMSLVSTNTDTLIDESSLKGLDEAAENLSLCAKMIIKLNDVFNYRRIISLEVLDDIISLEETHKNRHSFWDLIHNILEMVRKSLKWDDIYEPQYPYLVTKVTELFSVIQQRANEKGLTLIIAESFGELINISNIMLNSYPHWVVEGDDKYDFCQVISTLYQSFQNYFYQIAEMKFEDMDSKATHSPQIEDPSPSRDRSIISVSNMPQNDSSRLTQIVKLYKMSTMKLEHLKQVEGNENEKNMSASSFKDGRFGQGSFQASLKNKRQSTAPKVTFQKNESIDYTTETLMDNIVNEEDPFSAHIILQSFKFLNVLVGNLNENINLLLPVMKCGLLWKQLLFLLDDYSEWNFKLILDVTEIEKSIWTSLSFTLSYFHKISDQHESKEEKYQEKNNPEQEELSQFYSACTSLLNDKILEKLISDVEINEKGMLRITGNTNFLAFLEIYRSNDLVVPDLIWNESRKNEFKEILQKEIDQSMSSSKSTYSNPYKNFSYSDQDNQLEVDGVFIKLLNKDIYFAIKNPNEFLEHLIEKLSEMIEDNEAKLELLIAIRNTI